MLSFRYRANSGPRYFPTWVGDTEQRAHHADASGGGGHDEDAVQIVARGATSSCSARQACQHVRCVLAQAKESSRSHPYAEVVKRVADFIIGSISLSPAHPSGQRFEPQILDAGLFHILPVRAMLSSRMRKSAFGQTTPVSAACAATSRSLLVLTCPSPESSEYVCAIAIMRSRTFRFDLR